MASTWVEMIRTSATQFTDELFSDAYTTSVEKETVTISSGISGLRYLSLNGYDNALNGQITCHIDPNLQFADGVTTAPA